MHWNLFQNESIRGFSPQRHHFLSFFLQQEVADLRNQITQSGVQVDVDAPKGQDLSQVMEEMRANYEKLAMKNAEELKMWHENQVAYWWHSLAFS